ncbi:hypothetical protein NEOLEDRAFT_1143126 [Neolentinus lepideus HHB14362 ss-1]|uniref:C2H2-type domain-containing protein n=1 Tax=Neolentinus lepideus HHB14362 ss-1 TaxID=1314782 RepID=A0A165MQS1_9AGAM|nr:hypothetical protein NEOLEDRAFT_1143126 [Neolentinus lepideus HHB14362 ss-1]
MALPGNSNGSLATRSDSLDGWFDHQTACNNAEAIKAAYYAGGVTMGRSSDVVMISSRRQFSILFDDEDDCVPATGKPSTTEDEVVPINFPIHRPNVYHHTSVDHRTSPYSSYTPSPEAMESTLSSLNSSPLMHDDRLDIISSNSLSDVGENFMPDYYVVHPHQDYGFDEFIEGISSMPADSFPSFFSSLSPSPYGSPVYHHSATSSSCPSLPDPQSRFSPVSMSRPSPLSATSQLATLSSCPSPSPATPLSPVSPLCPSEICISHPSPTLSSRQSPTPDPVPQPSPFSIFQSAPFPDTQSSPHYDPLSCPYLIPLSCHSPDRSNSISPLSALSSLSSSPLSSPRLQINGLPPNPLEGVADDPRGVTESSSSWFDVQHVGIPSSSQPLRRSTRTMSVQRPSYRFGTPSDEVEANRSSRRTGTPTSGQETKDEDDSYSDAGQADDDLDEELSDGEYAASKGKRRAAKVQRKPFTRQQSPGPHGSPSEEGSTNVHYCHICHRGIGRKYDLGRHKKSVSHIANALAAGIKENEKGQVPCEYCGALLSRGDALKRHLINIAACPTSLIAQAIVAEEEKAAREKAEDQAKRKVVVKAEGKGSAKGKMNANRRVAAKGAGSVKEKANAKRKEREEVEGGRSSKRCKR